MIEPENQELIAITGIVHRTRITNSPDALLIFLVHGRAGNVSVMSIFERVCPTEANIILLQAPEEDPQSGYSWFVGKSFRDGSVEAAPILKRYMEKLIDTYRLTPSRKVGVGFSQGGMVLSVVFQTSTILDAVALVASMPIVVNYETRRDAPEVFGVHGGVDEVLPQPQVLPWYEKLRELGYNLRLVLEESVGHKIGSLGMKELTDWLKIL
jgi:predicted esterase